MSSCVILTKGADNKNVGSGKATLLVLNDTEICLFALAAFHS